VTSERKCGRRVRALAAEKSRSTNFARMPEPLNYRGKHISQDGGKSRAGDQECLTKTGCGSSVADRGRNDKGCGLISRE
jgi:hypothetical protein